MRLQLCCLTRYLAKHSDCVNRCRLNSYISCYARPFLFLMLKICVHNSVFMEAFSLSVMYAAPRIAHDNQIFYMKTEWHFPTTELKRRSGETLSVKPGAETGMERYSTGRLSLRCSGERNGTIDYT